MQGLDPDHKYSFRVRAIRADGTVSDYQSHDFTFNLLAAPSVSIVDIPANGIDPEQFLVGWTDLPEGTTGVQLQYRGDAYAGPHWWTYKYDNDDHTIMDPNYNGDIPELGDLQGGVMNPGMLGITGNYEYRVRAFDATGRVSQWSEPESRQYVDQSAPDSSQPSPTPTTATDTSLTFTWSETHATSAGAALWDGDGNLVSTWTSGPDDHGSFTATFNNLTPGTKYYVGVSDTNFIPPPAGEIDGTLWNTFGQAGSETTGAVAPAAPAIAVAANANPNVVNIRWTNSSDDEHKFYIEQSKDGSAFKAIYTADEDSGFYEYHTTDVAAHCTYRSVAANDATTDAPSPLAEALASYTKDQLAGIIYNETSLLRPQFKAGATSHHASDYDPASVAQLAKAREAIAHVNINRSRAGDTGGVAPTTGPTEQELKNPDVKREWDLCRDAAQKALDAQNGGSDPTSNARNYYISQGKLPPPKAGAKGWWQQKVPNQEIGPFRRIGDAKAGDVPPGNAAYVNIFKL